MKAYYEYEDGAFWAIRTDGSDCGTLQYVAYQLRTPDICLEAVKNYDNALMFVPEALKTTELCFEALKRSTPKYIIRDIPENIRTSDFYARWLIEAETLSPFEQIIPESMIEEIYRKAVKIDAGALNLVDVSKLTDEEYAEICRLAQV